MTPMRLEPAAPRSRVTHSSTEPLRSLSLLVNKLVKLHLCRVCVCAYMYMYGGRGIVVTKWGLPHTPNHTHTIKIGFGLPVKYFLMVFGLRLTSNRFTVLVLITFL